MVSVKFMHITCNYRTINWFFKFSNFMNSTIKWMPPLAIRNELVPVFIFFFYYSYMRAFSSSEIIIYNENFCFEIAIYYLYQWQKIKFYWIFSDSYLYIGKICRYPDWRKNYQLRYRPVQNWSSSHFLLLIFLLRL